MNVGSISLTFDCRLCVSKSQSVFEILQETPVRSESLNFISRSNYWDVKEISFMIFLYGIPEKVKKMQKFSSRRQYMKLKGFIRFST